MKKVFTGILVCLMVQVAFAQTEWTVQTVPNTRLQSDYIHVSDPDDWVTDETESRINAVLDNIRSEADVFVVVLSSIGDRSIEDFGTRLFNRWGIGDAERDNGVLMLMVEDQHKLRFETGYGVEYVLTDALCQKIFVQVIVPYFKEGDYNAGLYAGVCAVAGVFGKLPDDAEVTQDQIVSLKSTAESSQYNSEDEAWYEGWGSFGWIVIILVVLFNIGFVYKITNDMRKIKKEADPQHGDPNAVAKLFQEARQGIILYPIVGLFCLCPMALLVYPFFVSFVSKQKKQYRNTPRQCDRCGNVMRRLSEEEENAYMTSNQLFEEDNVKVKDYDIWLCDSCGRKMVVPFFLRRAGRYYNCPSCKCLAGKKKYDETVVRPTQYSSGKGLHHIVCLKCGHNFTIEYTIPKRSSSSSSSRGGGGGSFGGGSSGGGGYTGSW